MTRFSFRNLKVAGRLRLAYGSVMVLLLGITAIAWAGADSGASHARQTNLDVQAEQSRIT